MYVTHLPPEAVRLFNAIYRGAEDWSGELASFRGLMERSRRRVEFDSAYAANDREREYLDALPFLWDEVESSLQYRDPGTLLNRMSTPLYDAVRMMEAIRRARESADLSEQPVVNDFIRAGLACLEGRGESRAIAERLPLLKESCAALERFYRSAEKAMEPEARAGLDRGFAWLWESVAAAEEAAAQPGLEGLRAALADLKKSDTVIQNFLEWNRRRERSLEERYDRFRVPVVGRQAANMLEAARTVPRRHWKPAVEHAVDFLLPRFRGWWQQARQDALLPAQLRERLLNEVDEAIDRVEAIVGQLLCDDWTESDAADALENALGGLSLSLADVDRETLACDRLRGDKETIYLDVIRGLLQDTIPIYGLDGFVQACPPPPSWERITDALNAFVEGGDAEALCEGVELMLAAA